MSSWIVSCCSISWSPIDLEIEAYLAVSRVTRLGATVAMSITALTSHNLVFSQELESIRLFKHGRPISILLSGLTNYPASRSVGPSLRPNFLEQEPGSVLQIWCGKHRANIDD